MRKIGWGSLAPVLIGVAVILNQKFNWDTTLGQKLLKVFGCPLRIMGIYTTAIISIVLLSSAYYISCKYPKDFGTNIIRIFTTGFVLVSYALIIGGILAAIIFSKVSIHRSIF